MRTLRATTLILVCFIALFACKKTPPPEETTPPPVAAAPAPVPEPTPAVVPFSVTAVHLGKAIGSDQNISEPATTFGPKDTIYAAVESAGASPSVTLKARWTFGAAAKLVNESEQSIAPTGPTVSEFHISKASGWPAGKYKVEIWADGVSAGTQDFEVKK